MITNSQFKENIFSDPTLWLLIFSNFVTIYFAIKENWSLPTTMWVYWLQSVIIGFFNFIRILQLKDFSTEGFKINGQPTQPTQRTKVFTAFFFLFHYGLFHVVYLIFLFGDIINNIMPMLGQPNINIFSLPNFRFILMSALIFFINHLVSYFYNRPKDTKKQNIGSLMFYPYARIIPMHLTIIFGSFFVNSLPLFLILKTIADGIMHTVEHNVLIKDERA